MEINIKNFTSRILLEKVDNGVILYEIGDDGVVSSRIVYETYYKDGVLDYVGIGTLMTEMMESLKIPLEDVETNTRVSIALSRLDPAKPMLDEPDQDDENEDDEK